MHALLVLSAVLCSLPAVAMPDPVQDAVAPGVFKPSFLRLRPSLSQPVFLDETGHLLETESPQPGRSHSRGGRILLEGLMGVGLGIGSTALGALLTADYKPPLSLLLPISFLLMGSSLGVATAGSLLDGQGSFGATVLGSALGFAAPLVVGTGILAGSGCFDSSIGTCAGVKPLALSLLVLPTIGAIIGYEISAPGLAEPSRRAPGRHRPPPRLVPTLIPAQQGMGATLGLAGTL